jgi:hypothetical protein
MKIKVKRYKEIERVAFVEALQRVLREGPIDPAKTAAIIAAIDNAGLDDAIRDDLKLTVQQKLSAAMGLAQQ